MTAPLVVRRARTVLRVWGRDPVKMINGLATADIAAVTPESAAYTAFLTAKGRMVADARVLLRPGTGSPELLLTTDPDAAPGLLEHLRKFIPPLFARFEDVTADWRVVGVYGPGASETLSGAVEGMGWTGGALPADGAPEGAVALLSADPLALAVRSGETGEDGWDVLVSDGARGAGAAGASGTDVGDVGDVAAAAVGAADALEGALEAAGGRVVGEAALEPLRIAAGRPRWGAELTGDVIPLEAGLERAISRTKGCYTGQEVIIRILHRGHVNRHLRSLSFTGGEARPGTQLFEPGNEKPRGVVTSAVAGAGLGYVRREIEPPAELRAGSPDGPPVRVTALDG